MALHRLSSVTIGVPDVAHTASFYEDFGLTRTGESSFATVHGGEQLRLTPAPQRSLREIVIGVDDGDDIGRIALRLRRMGGIDFKVEDARIRAVEPVAGFVVSAAIMPRVDPAPVVSSAPPDATARLNTRLPALQRESRVRPRKLGHIVIGSVDYATTRYFLVEGIGFTVSDSVRSRAAFMRCSTDHHNILVQQFPVNFLHHTAWEVDDVDEIGRGATAMLESDPHRHVWGLGRHYLGSNFFWYLKDPAGNFSEYYSDMDCIVQDALWDPGVWEGARTLYSWGPPPPPSFLNPEDLAGMMAGAHGAQ